MTAIIVSAFAVSSLLIAARAPGLVHVAAVAGITCMIVILWLFSRRVPKTKKRKIGFVVSIHHGDNDEGQRVREDFVIPLRTLLRSTVMGPSFQFIELPQYRASKILDQEDAESVRSATKAHFMLYGRVRQRILLGKEHHILELEGLVAHRPVHASVKEQFAREFTELLPRRVNIERENDLLSFQFTSEWAGIVAEYVIGLAAAMSGDLDSSERLLRGALGQLGNKSKAFPIYAKLSQSIPIRLSQLYEKRAELSHKRWVDTRSDEDVAALGNNLEQVLESRKNEPNVLMLSAIHMFLSNRDVKGALGLLNRIKVARKGLANDELTAVWHYGAAFLRAYDGDLKTAVRHYRRAAFISVSPDIMSQVEGFLCWVVEKEPDKYQVYFCLGFFNWRTKGDTVTAVSDFNRFLAAGDEGSFVTERRLAEKWINQIEAT